MKIYDNGVGELVPMPETATYTRELAQTYFDDEYSEEEDNYQVVETPNDNPTIEHTVTRFDGEQLHFKILNLDIRVMVKLPADIYDSVYYYNVVAKVQVQEEEDDFNLQVNFDKDIRLITGRLIDDKQTYRFFSPRQDSEGDLITISSGQNIWMDLDELDANYSVQKDYSNRDFVRAIDAFDLRPSGMVCKGVTHCVYMEKGKNVETTSKFLTISDDSIRLNHELSLDFNTRVSLIDDIGLIIMDDGGDNMSKLILTEILSKIDAQEFDGPLTVLLNNFIDSLEIERRELHTTINEMERERVSLPRGPRRNSLLTQINILDTRFHTIDYILNDNYLKFLIQYNSLFQTKYSIILYIIMLGLSLCENSHISRNTTILFTKGTQIGMIQDNVFGLNTFHIGEIGNNIRNDAVNKFNILRRFNNLKFTMIDRLLHFDFDVEFNYDLIKHQGNMYSVDIKHYDFDYVSQSLSMATNAFREDITLENILGMNAKYMNIFLSIFVSGRVFYDIIARNRDRPGLNQLYLFYTTLIRHGFIIMNMYNFLTETLDITKDNIKILMSNIYEKYQACIALNTFIDMIKYIFKGYLYRYLFMYLWCHLRETRRDADGNYGRIIFRVANDGSLEISVVLQLVEHASPAAWSARSEVRTEQQIVIDIQGMILTLLNDPNEIPNQFIRLLRELYGPPYPHEYTAALLERISRPVQDDVPNLYTPVVANKIELIENEVKLFKYTPDTSCSPRFGGGS